MKNTRNIRNRSENPIVLAARGRKACALLSLRSTEVAGDNYANDRLEYFA